jgi:DNA polymerase
VGRPRRGFTRDAVAAWRAGDTGATVATTARMADDMPGAEAFIPVRRTLPSMRAAVDGCRGCPLYRDATQAVFGEGAARARLVIVGEQPGDVEDRSGHPFVGPAGRLLDEALAAAGLDRRSVYLTNAVKHFKYTMRGKRRIHAKPRAGEVEACRPWLEAELGVIEPEAVLLLGATAVASLLGTSVKVLRDRGKRLSTAVADATFVTVHPAAVLRAGDDRAAAQAAFFADVATAAAWLAKGAKPKRAKAASIARPAKPTRSTPAARAARPAKAA